MSRGEKQATQGWRWPALAYAMLAIVLIGGCTSNPSFIVPTSRKTIDRKVVEYPSNFVLQVVASNLTAPTAVAFVNDDGPFKGSMLVAESGVNDEPRIYGWKPDGSYFSVYPRGPQLLPTFGLLP